MKLEQLKAGFVTFIAVGFLSGPIPTLAQTGTTTLPPPEKLVTMSIQQRLNLFESMQGLPENQRDANLNALRAEINSLSPAQKQEMADRFHSELAAMPADQQESLRQQLLAVQQMNK